MTIEGPLEVELKYRFRQEGAAERFATAEVIGTFAAAGGARSSQYEDRYLDTRDGALDRAGYFARLRQSRSTTVVTVKSTATTEGALQRRIELEGPADRTLAPIAWPPSSARSMILELCGDAPLEERVIIRQLRTKRRLKSGETTVELSVDYVDVLKRKQVVDHFIELEIELVSGDEGPLTDLGAMLDADPDLSPSSMSKLQAALMVIGPMRRTGAGRRDAADGVKRSDVATPPAGSADAAGTGGSGQARGGRRTAASDEVAAVADAESAQPAEIDSDEPADDGRDTPAAGESPTRDDSADADPAGQAGREPAGTIVAMSGGELPEAGQAAPAASAEPPYPEIDPNAPEPLVVGRTPGVTGDDVVAEAGRKVLRFHLARLIAREAGTRTGHDPEDLHAMRVATRRMRAAWRVFGDGFRPESTRRYRTRLRDVAGKLGAVRDLDVLVMALEEYRADLPEVERAGLEPLAAEWRSERDMARAILVRELDSKGYRRFVDDYRTFVLSPGMGAAIVGPTEPHHVRDTAGSRIQLAYEQVRAYQSVLRWADVPTLHQLRIAGKWLRYTLEFVKEPLGPEASALIERVVALQDHLGLLNDAEVAATMARALLVERSGQLTEGETSAIGRYLVSREREVARLHRGASGPWRGVSGPVFRRGLGRAIAAL